MINYLIKLLSFKMNKLPTRKLLYLERKISNNLRNLNGTDRELFRMVFYSQDPRQCFFAASRTTNIDIQDYATLKGNYIYYSRLSIH